MSDGCVMLKRSGDCVFIRAAGDDAEVLSCVCGFKIRRYKNRTPVLRPRKQGRRRAHVTIVGIKHIPFH